MTAEEAGASSNDSDEEFCTFAAENPRCPYLTQIKQQGEDIKQIKRALIGDDMQSGLVAKVNSMRSTWRAIQPYLLIGLTAIVTYGASKIHW